MSDLVVDMSQQRETTCRFCGGRSLLFPMTGGDYSYFECDNCGRYGLSGTAEWVIERGGASPARLMEVPAWLEPERQRGVEVPMVLANRIEAGKTLPPSTTPVPDPTSKRRAMPPITRSCERTAAIWPPSPIGWRTRTFADTN